MNSYLKILSLMACCYLSCWAVPKMPRPKLYGKAVSERDLNTRYSNVRKKTVVYHNFFRSRVDPPASDMLEMTWHKGAAEDAQRWAERCELLVHDDARGRWVQDYGSCGQNIFVSNVKVPWFFAIKLWFMEHANFTYGGRVDNPFVVGHYTQMVWYSTHKVGCGFHYCGTDRVRKPFYNYVCNYCPIGNYPDRFNRPYSSGSPCSKCPGQCKHKRLCTNGCGYADMWSNCVELNKTFHNWLCQDKYKREDNCRATCKCESKIW